MTRRAVLRTVELIEEFIDQGREYIFMDTFKDTLLKVAPEKMILQLGCKHVTSPAYEYIELPYHGVSKRRLQSVLDMWVDEADNGQPLDKLKGKS